MPGWSVTTWLIVLCAAVFFLDRFSLRFWPKEPFLVDQYGRVVLSMSQVELRGHFSAVTVLEYRQIWRYFTFQFLHGSLSHLMFNMFVLYMFGPVVEQYLGRRKFIAFYLLCGCGGALTYLLLYKLDWLDVGKYAPLIGASAGIFGVLIAAARLFPHTQVLVFGLVPARLRSVAIGLLCFAMLSLFSDDIARFLYHRHLLTPLVLQFLNAVGSNAGGEAAHLGGAIAGFLLMLDPQLLSIFEFPFPRERSGK